jgi:hypothetical protein
MRSISLALVLTAFLFSCNSSNNDRKADGPDSTQAADKGAEVSRTMTDAVNDLKAILESNDKERIAALIDFPVADTVMGIYLDDSTFQETYKANGNKLTRSMFMNYFDPIQRHTYLDQITRVFEYVPIDSLRYTKELSREIKNKNEPCASHYHIAVEGDIVTLSYVLDDNDLYIKKGTKEEQEAFEDAGCEYGVYWIFRFDGNKFRLVQYAAAG